MLWKNINIVELPLCGVASNLSMYQTFWILMLNFTQIFFVAILLTKIFWHYHTVFIIICKIRFIWSPGNVIHWSVIQPSGRNEGTVAARHTSQQSVSHEVCLGSGLSKVLPMTRGQRLYMSWRGRSHSTAAALICLVLPHSRQFMDTLLIPEGCPSESLLQMEC